MSYTILIVDDHPMTVDSYINLLSDSSFKKANVTFITCYNTEEAYNKINYFEKQKINIDLALLDISLPPYKEFKIENGIDLASIIRKKYSSCKIILLTMHSDAVTVNKVIKAVNPEGFISKNDINFELFPIICKKIVEGEIFRSDTIAASQKELIKRNINWDSYDNEILLLISKGVKMVKLPEYIPLSMSAIEKRKANIKDQLLQGKGNDIDLIEKAKKIGLL